MSITLQVLPAVTVSWETFQACAPPFSIALDGYVSGGPRFNGAGPWVTFNHHEEVDRLATRSTCAQVLMAIRQGLFQTFRDTAGDHAVVWVNDCDEDVCLSWTLLKHHYLATSTMNPALNRLVAMEDALDCTAGAYPFPIDLPMLQELAWVFQNYRQFRLSGQLAKLDPAAYGLVIANVEERILAHVMGRGGSIPLDVRYDRIGGGTGWAMVREIGAQARTAMFADGIRAFLAVTELPSGRWSYVFGKMSPFVPIDLVAFMAEMNRTEPGWGGGDSVGGSPRGVGSSKPPEEVARVFEEVARAGVRKPVVPRG